MSTVQVCELNDQDPSGWMSTVQVFELNDQDPSGWMYTVQVFESQRHKCSIGTDVVSCCDSDVDLIA